MSDALQDNLNSALNGDVRDHQQPGERPENELKMWLLVRKDLPMSIGKALIQSPHAMGTCMVNTAFKNPDLVKTYLSHAQPKISVGVKNLHELETCIALCREVGIETVTVTDAGRTEFNEPTTTFGAIGPCYRDDLPKRVRNLQRFTGWSTENDA